ncbi:MAG: SMC-Scp complex subunit ScpB [Rhodospirillales bacterium]|nr:SMC-Scp complex subunit ScpB [Rhodospirillales bacterium]MCB9995042.1 SMC-Scp complex subunit ScpB [Rhodospirillales bacterium]
MEEQLDEQFEEQAEEAATPASDAENVPEDKPARDKADDLRVIEALLFAAAEPMTANAIRDRMGQDADVGGLLMELQGVYEGRGVQLVNMDGSWAFRTAADLGDALQVTKEVQRKLSRAAMETLAIVAYHQPVTRAEIENIRGVATHKGTLDVLMEAGWVKPGRRRETPGRPLTWVTSTAFMDHFGLESMTELPGLDELKASGLLDRRPAIDTVPGTGELFDDDMDAVEADAADDPHEEDSEDDDVFADEILEEEEME